MRNIKKFLALALACVMMLACVPTVAFAASYTQSVHGYYSMKKSGDGNGNQINGGITSSFPYRTITDDSLNTLPVGTINLHWMSDGSTSFPVYCIQPNKEAGSSYSKESAYPWTEWPAYAKEAAAKAMYWGYPNYNDSNYTASEQQGAVQVMIFDIACGFIKKSNGQFVREEKSKLISRPDNYQTTTGFADSTYGVADSNVRAAANALLNRMNQSASTIGVPSYATADGSSFNYLTLTYNPSSGLFEGSWTDTTGYASYFNFAHTYDEGLTISQSGSTLTITATAAAIAHFGIDSDGSDTKFMLVDSNTPNVSISTSDVEIYYANQKQTMLRYVKSGSSSYTKAHLALRADAFGYTKLTKTSADTTITNGNSCYSLEGATYGVYGTAADANSNANLIARMVTNASGVTDTITLPIGQYYVKEITAPPGFAMDPDVHSVTVEQNETATVTVSDVPTMDPIGILLKKVDAAINEPGTTSGNMSLENAKYSVKFYGGQYATAAEAEASGNLLRSWIFKTDADGYSDMLNVAAYFVSGDELYYSSTGMVSLPYGTVVIQEIEAPTGFLLNDTKYVVHITEDGTDAPIVDTYNAPVVPETAIKGGVKVQKADADADAGVTKQGSATLAGAVFGIYNDNNKSVVVNGTTYAQNAKVLEITTNANGIAQSGSRELPYGNYVIKEITPPTGYELNANWSKSFTISEDGVVVDAQVCSDSVIRGGLSVQKKDAGLGTTTPYGDASFNGVVFSISNASAEPVVVNGQTYAPGAQIMTITTNASGKASTAGDVLPYGDYTVKELSVPDGNGYALNSAFVETVTVSEKGVIVTVNPCSEAGNLFGGISIQKIDADLRIATAQGDASLAGAQYEIKNNSAYAVFVDGRAYNVGAVVMTITTDANGFAQTQKVMPMGTYIVTEKSPSTGYLNNDSFSATVAIRENDHMYALEDTTACPESVIRGGISVQKLDKDTGENHGPGGISLAGAEMTIINRSAHAVVVDGQEIVPYVGDFDPQDRSAAGIVTRIYTNENGVASTTADKLPYGTYEVFETKAPAGYMLGTYDQTEPWHQTVEVREDGHIYALDGNKSVVDELARLDIKFVKAGFRGNNQVFLANVAFRLTRIDETGTAVESHIVVTDPNGVFNSANQPNTSHTNGNDAAVSADGVVDDSALNYQYGIWFGDGDPVDSAPDGKRIGALIAYPAEPDGPDWTKNYYILEELACEANEGYVISDPIKLKIYKSATNNDEPYYVGMIHNTAPTMSTTLVGNDTQAHQAQSTGRITLTDTITYSGLKSGKTYVIKGILMDRDTEQPIEIGGAQVEGSTRFRASDTTGTAKVTFTIDASELAGKSIVAFEYMYLNDVLISEHTDIFDEDQMVTFPKLRTVAAGADNAKEINVGDGMVINDVVYYENLAPGYNYVIEGTLVDAETGAVLKDAHGDKITAQASLEMADLSSPRNGNITVTFNFDGHDGLLGKKAVVFEKLLVNGSTVLAKHEERLDENQSVYFPKITTSLVDEDGNDVVLVSDSIKLIDTVHYEGLVPDEAYTVEGVLIDRETGEPVKRSNGDDVTGRSSFTADAMSGDVEVEFEFDASELGGHALVVFEKLYNAHGVIASHEDIDDEEQTVRFPSIGTSAHDIDGNKELLATNSVKIVDEVIYAALEANGKDSGERHTYKLSGILMDAETGDPLLDADGNEITAEKEFTIGKNAPESGVWTIEFNIQGVDLRGKAVVAFEELYMDGRLVAEHKDIDDDEQTVHFPEISTSFVDEAEHHITMIGTSTLVDHVTYKNLTGDKEYTVKGVLMIRDGSVNGKALKDSNGDQYSAEATFTADASGNGVTDLIFDLDTDELGGEAIVAFEKIFDGDREVANHEDIDDDDQHVRFPTISTVATDGERNKIVEIDHGEDIVIEDVVTYENLIPGKEYSLSGILRIKEDGGAPVKNDEGEAVVAEKTFTADEASGEVTVVFTIPYEKVQGKHLVAVETLLFEGATIAVHDDLEDEDQTVFVPWDVELFKYDASNRTPLEGAVFEIVDITAGSLVDDKQLATSDENGHFYFNGLPGHEYSIKELTAPEGYRLGTASEFFVTVKEDGTLEGDTEIPNIHGGTVVITKVDLVTGEPVEGCEVTVYKITEEVDVEATQKAIEAAAKAAHVKVKDFDSSKVAPIMKETSRVEVFKQTTDKNGRIYFYTTETGTYVYKETATRTGYYLNTDEYRFEIGEDLTVTGTVRFKNVPFGTVVLTKVDKSGNPLAGAEFSIYDATTDKFLGKGVSGKNGRIYFVSPGPGKYYFIETKAPEGYALVEGRNHFEIASDYTVSGKVVLVNDRTGTQNKTGDENNIGAWIAIASFAVLAAGCGVFFVVKKPRKKEDTE